METGCPSASFQFVRFFGIIQKICGSASELVFGLVFKTCGGSPRAALGGFDSHALPPFLAFSRTACGGLDPCKLAMRRYGVSSPNAGWSSPVARRAHNPKVASSNLAPATNRQTRTRPRAAKLWGAVVSRAVRCAAVRLRGGAAARRCFYRCDARKWCGGAMRGGAMRGGAAARRSDARRSDARRSDARRCDARRSGCASYLARSDGHRHRHRHRDVCQINKSTRSSQNIGATPPSCPGTRVTWVKMTMGLGKLPTATMET